MFRGMRSFRPDVVYMPLASVWSGFWRDSVIALIGKCFHAKIVGHIHGPKIANVLSKRGIVGWFVRRSIFQFDTLLVLDSSWQEWLIAYGYSKNVGVVPSTLEESVFDVGTAYERDYAARDPVGLFVGQVGKRKGVFDLLEALSKLKSDGRSAKIRIVGPPEYEGEWEALMRRRDELDVADVADFVGPRQGAALYEEFKNAAFFVLPSHREGLPVVLFEAGAFGLPVLATPVGGIPQLLRHERNALLVEPGHTDQIAEAIDRLRSHRDVRERLGRQLRRDVSGFHPKVVCKKIADAIDRSLNLA
jgi:glycosyltransferase involved in cell wall biosynthesis